MYFHRFLIEICWIGRLFVCSYLSGNFWKKGLCFFPKNPARHFADLAMIENEEAVLRSAPVPQVITIIITNLY